jgi:chromosome segregation ATPase
VADSDNDLENRVTILEREVARLRDQAAITSSDAAAARVLAAGADRDVSDVRAELRAHTQSLNALRVTQLEMQESQREMQREIQEIQQTLSEHAQAIVALDQKMSAGFATLHTGMAQVVTLLNGKAASEQG